MKKNRFIFLFIFLYFCLIGFIFAMQKKVDINQLKPSSTSLVADVMDYLEGSYEDFSIIVVGKDLPQIDKRETIDLAGQQIKEIERYFEYWLDHWNIDIKTLDSQIKINENIFIDEAVKITLIQSKFAQLTDKSRERLNKIVSVLKSREGVIAVGNNRVFTLRLNSIFNITDETDIDLSSSFLLDSIMDIIKIYGKETYLRIEIYKEPIFEEYKKTKEISKFVEPFGKLFLEHGIKKEHLFLFAKEDNFVTKKELEVYCLKKKISSEEEAAFFLEGIDVLTDEDLKKRKFSKKKTQEGARKKVYIYKDGIDEKHYFTPSGWIGDIDDLEVDFSSQEEVHSGSESIKIEYKATGTKGWAGIQWQYPPNNRGHKNQAVDLSGFSKLVFYAKGEKHGERVAEFKVGGIKGKYSDSDSAWIGNIKLTSDWTQFEISLTDKDLTNIMGGFSFTLNKYDNRYGATIYLDEIHFE
ncbi:MAG: hypothetical protein GY817_08255 [bacterium]|nr:hypothetical protein [bacterium]